MRLDRPAMERGERNIFDDLLVNSGNVLRSLGRDDDRRDSQVRYAQ